MRPPAAQANPTPRWMSVERIGTPPRFGHSRRRHCAWLRPTIGQRGHPRKIWMAIRFRCSSEQRLGVDIHGPWGLEPAVEEGRRVRPTEHDVPAPAIRPAGDVGRCRAEDRDGRLTIAGPFAKPRGHRLRFTLRAVAVGDPDGELDEPAEWRRAEPPPKRELGVVEGTAVVLGDGPDRGVLRLI